VATDARFLERADLFAEHPDVERAGGLVLFDVLAFGLVALDEIALAATESSRPTKTDLDPFRDHLAPELSRSASAHSGSFVEMPRTPYSFTLFWTMPVNARSLISSSRPAAFRSILGVSPVVSGPSHGRRVIAPFHRSRTEVRATATRLHDDRCPERLWKRVTRPAS